MKDLRVADAISEVFGVFRRCNKYIDETAPWVLAKDEAKSDRLAEVLYNLAESITVGASLLYSFLPETAEKIVAQLHTQLRGFEELNQFGLYENGTKVTDKPEILFARLDAKDVMPEVEAIREAQKKEFEAEQKALARRLLQKKKQKTSSTSRRRKKSPMMILRSFSSRWERSFPVRLWRSRRSFCAPR